MWDEPVSVWEHYRKSYEEAINEKHEDDSLSKLEAYVWEELPDDLQERAEKHITSEEYGKIVRWKLKRGKWRPRLQAFADALSDSQVIAASTQAFSHIFSKDSSPGDVGGALKPLLDLKGCGPATASAVLAIAHESFPFMSDELLLLATGERKYTKAAYIALVRVVRERAEELSKQGDTDWTARDIERAAFAHGSGALPPSKVAVKKEAKKGTGQKRHRGVGDEDGDGDEDSAAKEARLKDEDVSSSRRSKRGRQTRKQSS